MKTITAVGLAFVVGFIVWMAIGAVAFAEEQKSKHVWFLVADPECNFNADGIAWQIHAQKAYAPYVTSFDIVCFPHADMMDLKPIVAVLKQVYPGDEFVFTFDITKPANELEWRSVMASADGRVIEGGMGRSFIADYYAISALNATTMAHEATHLILHATHPRGTDPEKPETWLKQ